MLGHLSWVFFFLFFSTFFFFTLYSESFNVSKCSVFRESSNIIFVSSEICHFCDGRGGNKMGDTGEGGRKTIYN